MFPFSVLLKSILKSFELLSANVSVLLIAEPLFVLIVRNENQSLQVVLPFFIFAFIFFLKFNRSFYFALLLD